MVVDYTAGHIREVQYENQYEKNLNYENVYGRRKNYEDHSQWTCRIWKELNNFVTSEVW